jgi:hypothetical protein
VGLLVGTFYPEPVAARLTELESLLAALPEADGLVLAAAAAGRSVTIDPNQVTAVFRRALLLHAAGGDALRPYDLEGRAVAAAAAELDAPERRAELVRGLDELAAAEGLPHLRRLLGALAADPELAWRAFASSVLLEELEDDG